jgi:AraC family ethanolamine operon transcriptional activator
MAAASPGWQQEHIVTEPGRYEVRMNVAQSARVQLATTDVSLGRIVRGLNPSGSVSLAVPIWSVGDIISRGRTLGPMELVTVPADEEMDLTYEGPTKQLIMTLDERLFAERLRKVWRRDASRAFTFESPSAQSRFVERALHVLSNPGDVRSFEIALTDQLLAQTAPPEERPGNHWRRRIALEGKAYICERLEEELNLADLADAVGVSLRTLQYAFRETFGFSPAEFARRERLLRVRGQLRQGAGQATVTEVAMRYGFHHLGRFAESYRRTFGEKPSETLKRARYL